MPEENAYHQQRRSRLYKAAKQFADQVRLIPTVQEVVLCGSMASQDPYPLDLDLAVVLISLEELPQIARRARQISSYDHDITRLLLRSLSLRPGNLLTLLYRALSLGFKGQRYHYPLPSKLHGSGFLPWRDLHPQVCAALRWARSKADLIALTG